MTVSVGKYSFNGGIFSPDLYGRSDIPKYGAACKTLLNAIPHAHGGVSNRGGSQYIADCKYDVTKSRLISFQFSVIQAYVLEFYNLGIRVIKDDGLVVYQPGNATGLVNATYKWTASGSGTSEYYCELAAGGDPSLDIPEFVYEDPTGSPVALTQGTLGSLTAGEYSYGDNDTLGYSTIYVRLSDSTDPDTKAADYVEAAYKVNIVTPYTSADLPLVKYVQSADVLYLFHPDYAPRTLSRTADDVWTLSTISFVPTIGTVTGVTAAGGAKYAVSAVSAEGELGLPGTGTQAIGSAVTWTAVSGAEYYNVYRDGNSSGTYGLVGTANTESFTEPTSSVPNYSYTPPSANNPFGVPGDYPGVGTFYEQRLVYGRTDNDPQTVWGSVTGSFVNMSKSKPLQDDDSYKFTINSRQVNAIKWMLPLDDLILGTAGSIWKMTAGSQADSITPSNVLIRNQVANGVSDLQPIVVENSALYVDSSNEAVRDLSFSFDSDVYKGNDLTILAKNLFEGFSIVAWAYQRQPSSIVWCVRNDGLLLGLTYLKEHDVWAWHTHKTDGEYEDVVSLETESGDNEVYVIVRRLINGTEKRYIEKLRGGRPLDSTNVFNVKDAYFVDSGLSWDNPIAITGITQADPCVVTAVAHGLSNGDYIDIDEIYTETDFEGDISAGMNELNGRRFIVANATTDTLSLKDEEGVDIDATGYGDYIKGGYIRKCVTTLSGLDHLEGKDVAVLANGSVVPNITVSSGSITLPKRASRIHVGLGYYTDIETLEFVIDGQDGTSRDKHRNIPTMVVVLDECRALWAGTTKDNLIEQPFRTDEAYGDPIRPFTGDKEVLLETGLDRESRVFLRNVDPVPMTILAIIARLDNGSI